MSSRYHAVYEAWRRDPEVSGASRLREIDWFRPADRIFDPSAGVYGRWFTGAMCNTCHNAVDRHVESRARRPACRDP